MSAKTITQNTDALPEAKRCNGEELATAQGIKPVERFEELLGPTGIWDDEDFEAFQQWLIESRQKGH